MENPNTSNQLAISTKQELIENIQRWVLLDSQLKIVNEKTKKIRETKTQLCDKICEYMDQNNLTQNKIGISDGELRIIEKKDYSPLSYTYVERCLAEIITDKTQVDYIIQYLKEKREITSSLDIRRTYK
uniref:Uncharacterized protein n=1 Tax=viral metagenome TaxID=1070528 RepID=A0A6C0JM62_9ZZZZ